MAEVGSLKFSVSVAGFKEMDRKLKTAFDDGDSLLAEPWRDALDNMGKLGEQSAIAGAPLGPSGRTIARMGYRVQKAAMPRYVVVKTTAKSSRGYPYPRLQEYSPFAQSRYRKGQNRNRNWFFKAIQRIFPTVETRLQQTAREIEAKWAA